MREALRSKSCDPHFHGPVECQVMKGDSDGVGGGKAMARSVEMLEQLLNSGTIQKEDLESLKSMLAQVRLPSHCWPGWPVG